jgi:hypothetical protein
MKTEIRGVSSRGEKKSNEASPQTAGERSKEKGGGIRFPGFLLLLLSPCSLLRHSENLIC